MPPRQLKSVQERYRDSHFRSFITTLYPLNKLIQLGFSQVMAITCGYKRGYERDKCGYVFDRYMTDDQTAAGRPSQEVVLFPIRAVHVYSTMARVDVRGASFPTT
jgi:hypothetical protein